MSFFQMVELCRSARFPPLMASRQSTSPGSLPIAQRSPKILKCSPALLRSVWRFFLLPIRPPKSTKSAPCTLTPAQPRSGSARWTAPSPFLFLLTINYLLLRFARPSPPASREMGHQTWTNSNRCAHLHESHRTLRDGSFEGRFSRHFVP